MLPLSIGSCLCLLKFEISSDSAVAFFVGSLSSAGYNFCTTVVSLFSFPGVPLVATCSSLVPVLPTVVGGLFACVSHCCCMPVMV